MSQEQYKNYFIGTLEGSKPLIEEYKTAVLAKRDELFQKLLDNTGAIAWRQSRHWGQDDYVTDLVFPEDHEDTKLSHVKITERSYFDGKPVTCLRGKLNSKAGKAFNKHIDETNETLKELPSFSVWFINKFDLQRTGVGGNHESGRGMALLSSAAGYKNNQIIVTIPNEKCRDVENPVVPDFLEQVTYGQFYDFTETE